MERYLNASVTADLAKKLVFLVGPRQVRKTTLAKALIADYPQAQYFNWGKCVEGWVEAVTADTHRKPDDGYR